MGQLDAQEVYLGELDPVYRALDLQRRRLLVEQWATGRPRCASRSRVSPSPFGPTVAATGLRMPRGSTRLRAQTAFQSALGRVQTESSSGGSPCGFVLNGVQLRPTAAAANAVVSRLSGCTAVYNVSLAASWSGPATQSAVERLAGEFGLVGLVSWVAALGEHGFKASRERIPRGRRAVMVLAGRAVRWWVPSCTSGS